MSRCATPRSQSCRIRTIPSSITTSSTSDSPSVFACSKNSVTSMYSAFGVSSTMPYEPRDPDAGVTEEPQRVVLQDDQPPDRADRRLVLELPVEDRASDPVPAIRADVRGRVDLPERPRPVLQGHPQRGRPAGTFQAERLDLGDHQAELVAHRAHDGVAALASQVEVCRVAAPAERHGEHVLGYQPAERDLRDRGRQDPAVDARNEVVGGQVEAEHDFERDEHVDAHAHPPTGRPARHEDERHRDQRDDHRLDGLRWERVVLGTGQHRHRRVRQGRVQHTGHEPVGDHERREEHDQVAEPADDREGDHDDPPHGEHDGEARGQVQRLGQAREAVGPAVSEPAEDRLVERLDPVRRAQADVERDPDQEDDGEQPPPTGAIRLPSGAVAARPTAADGSRRASCEVARAPGCLPRERSSAGA